MTTIEKAKRQITLISKYSQTLNFDMEHQADNTNSVFMKNEEKALDISDECIAQDYKQVAYSSAMRMAEWKDEQFKDYLIELSKKYLDDAILALNNHDEDECEFLNGKVNVLYCVIDELFNK